MAIVQELRKSFDSMADIPTIDFSPFMQDNGAICGEAPTVEQRKCAQEINSAFRVHGFLFLENIGVSSQELQLYYDMAAALFSLPNEHKRTKFVQLTPETNIGFIGLGHESLNRKRPPDLKEVSCYLHATYYAT